MGEITGKETGSRLVLRTRQLPVFSLYYIPNRVYNDSKVYQSFGKDN